MGKGFASGICEIYHSAELIKEHQWFRMEARRNDPKQHGLSHPMPNQASPKDRQPGGMHRLHLQPFLNNQL